MPTLAFAPALPQDTRYRDMCVSGAQLSQSAFDSKTGQVKAPDVPFYGEVTSYGDSYYEDYFYYYADSYADSISMFEQRFVGKVSGAKPPLGTCMPMKDTPVVPVTNYVSNPNSAFSYYMNLDDRAFSDVDGLFDLYKGSNYYKDNSFFLGGVLGCPDIIEPRNPFTGLKRDQIVDRALLTRFKADNCYNYYILNRAISPWFTLERPEGGSDDPLSIFEPDRTYLNSCQPLVAGNRAKDIQHTAWSEDPAIAKHASNKEKNSGFAPVLQYANRPDMDEAEYLLSTYLQAAWNENFVNINPALPFKIRDGKTIPKNFPKIGLPCVIDGITGQTGGSGHDDIFPDPPPADSPPRGGQCRTGGDSMPDTPADSPAEAMADSCGQVHFDVPGDYKYKSPKVPLYYCPNVEKLVDPSHPFSPRNDMIGRTDRSYSATTSLDVPYPNSCGGETRLGYTDYRDREHPDAFPAVQCGIVPVDILEFRNAAFHNCIMQRINTNFNAWIAAGYPSPQRADGSGFQPPCATRYWEQDDFDSCPVKMSIQQCCHIIIKDVVPANFLKLRTCEGLLQRRRDDAQLQELIESMLGNGDYGYYSEGDSSADSAADSSADSYSDSYYDEGGTGGSGSTGAAGQGDGPYTHITDDTFGILGKYNYDRALYLTIQLNKRGCDNTEPDQYRFDNYAEFQKYYKPDDGSHDADIGKFVGVHMPYMRWWDTGVSAGNPRKGGSFVNTLGSFDTLIGVGREERDKDAAKKAYDEARDPDLELRPGLKEQVKTPQRSEMGRVGGWSELKAHEMWTIRRSNMFCIGRYEKLFKQGSPENFVLAKSGAGYTSRAGLQWPWSLGWRGYATDTHNKAFPTWPTLISNNSFFTNLDNALIGDTVIYNINGMRQVAYVKDIGFDIETRDKAVFSETDGKFHLNDVSGPVIYPTRVYVVTWDQGKFPTSTGSSILWGMGPERTIYKTKVPQDRRQEICNRTLRAVTDFNDGQVDYYDYGSPTPCQDQVASNSLTPGLCMSLQCQPTCADPDYSACVLPNGIDDWKMALIYRPSQGVRSCLGASLDGDLPYSMNATYNWQGTLIIPPPPPQPNVIYQGLTQEVNTDAFAWCVNSGYDPPVHYSRDYRGPQTGALTDSTICAGPWKTCNSGGPATEIDLFPKGN